jgi:hypothetical protein
MPSSRDELDAFAAQLVGADRLARVLISGFRVCAEQGAPLTERQQSALLTTALLEFDGFHAEVRGTLEVDRLLARLTGGEPEE